MVTYSKTNARQNFATLLRKSRFGKDMVGIGKSPDEVEVLLIPRPLDWDPGKRWVLVPEGSICFSDGPSKDILYKMYRLITERMRLLLA